MSEISGTPGAILAILRDGPRQAQEIAEPLGIDTSAVRRHLEGLRSEGYVEAEDVVSGPGRPKKMYRLSLRGEETFPRDYALFLSLLLGKVEETGGRDALLRLVASLAKDLGASLPKRPDSSERLSALLKLYNDLGFEAHLERDGGTVRLVQRNCVILRTARADPEAMCSCFDQGIIRAALPGAKVGLTSCMATGDALCRHTISLPKPRRAS